MLGEKRLPGRHLFQQERMQLIAHDVALPIRGVRQLEEENFRSRGIVVADLDAGVYDDQIRTSTKMPRRFLRGIVIGKKIFCTE